MKKILLFTFAFLLQGCTIIVTSDSLRVREDEQKVGLLPLNMGNADTSVTTNSIHNTITHQGHIYTLFQRELQQNIFVEGEEKYGHIEMVLTLDKRDIPLLRNSFIIAANVLTFGAATVFGMPMYTDSYLMEFDINIFNAQGVRIKQYRYDDESYFTHSWAWHDNYQPDAQRVLLATRMLAQFKQDIKQDIEFLNQRLLQDADIIDNKVSQL